MNTDISGVMSNKAFTYICKYLDKQGFKNMKTEIPVISYVDESGWKISEAIGRKFVFQKEDMKVTVEDGYRK